VSGQRALILSLLAATVVLDQITKIAVDQTLVLHESVPVIEGFFHLTYVRNKGAAFGILAGGPPWLRLSFLIVFSIVAAVFVFMMLRRLPADEKMLAVALTLILGGAIGNLIDRVWRGEVIDFFDFHYRGFHWPAFNIADSCITVGVALALLRLVPARGEDPFSPKRRSSS
jgi:signal peptidase II